MKTITFHTTALETNTYLALNGERAFVVDPGADADKILAAAEAEGAKIEWVLLTHAHFDHIGGVAELQRAGAQVVLHRDDLGIVSSFKNLAFYAGVKVEKFIPDVTVSGGETLDVAGSKSGSSTPPGTPPAACAMSRTTSYSRGTPSSSSLTAGRISRPAASKSSKIPSSTSCSSSRVTTAFCPGTARPPRSLSRGSTTPFSRTEAGG